MNIDIQSGGKRKIDPYTYAWIYAYAYVGSVFTGHKHCYAYAYAHHVDDFLSTTVLANSL